MSRPVADRNASARVAFGFTTYSSNAGSVMQLGPPWSITVVTPDCTPTRSASMPKRPVTYWNTCACVSISPGRTSLPRTSTTSRATLAVFDGSTAAILPSRTATSRTPSIPLAGTIT